MIRGFFTLCVLCVLALIGMDKVMLALDTLQTVLSNEYHHAHELLDERHAK
jgi:hypothetical protein